MKKNIKQLKIHLSIFVCFVLLPVLGQTNTMTVNALQGEWLFESAESGTGKSTVYYDKYNDYIEVYTSISISGDTITFADKELNKTFSTRYEASDNLFGFESCTAETIIIEWMVLGNNLYLEYQIKKRPDNQHEKALLIYKRI